MVKKIGKCPDCNGTGGDSSVDITDYVECPTCDGTGLVEDGTKSWAANLLNHQFE